MNEKEKSVLYALSEEPVLFEKVTIRPAIFTGKSRRIFDELQRQFNISQSFSYEEAADKLQMKVSELHELFKGCYRFDASKLDFVVKRIERESLSKKVTAVLKKEMDIELKTGTVNDSSMAEIRRMFADLEALNEDGDLSMGFTSVEEKDISWLWPGRIPLGMITLIAGHPGIGKSFFTAWLAAQLSNGRTLPGEDTVKIKPCSTLFFSAEDDPGQTIKPRLAGNKAVMEKCILFIDPMKFSLNSVGMLERELDKNKDIRLVILDPLNAFLGTGTDYFKDPDVRRKLLPLKELAEKRMIAVIGVVHFNKKEDSEIITRIGGSMAFAGVARSILGISYDNRETAEDNQDIRLLSSVKMNLARKPDTLSFKINPDLRIDVDPTPVLVDAETIFSRDARERKQKQGAADTWLLEYLRSNPESLSKDVVKAGEEEGFPRATLYRAKKRLDSQGLTDATGTGFSTDKKSYWILREQKSQ